MKKRNHNQKVYIDTLKKPRKQILNNNNNKSN